MPSPFQSETVGAVFGALSEAQKTIQNPTKNAKNSHFKNTYTTLDEGLNVVREALSAVGICVFQRTYLTDTLLMLETVLGHSSGEWLASHYPVIAVPYKPQDGLAALTYARRGALFAAVGIAGEDDDGNTANKVTTITTGKDDAESTKLLAAMMEDLRKCKTPDDLAIWTVSNKPNKGKLNLTDQALIVREYKAIEKYINDSAKGDNNG
jgi:hypothetical protein